MIIRKLRLDKGLSQEQLADMAGISTRTLQRLERGAKASPETLKCLAAVLEVEFTTLREEQTMPTVPTTPPTMEQPTPSAPAASEQMQLPELDAQEREAMEYVRDIKSFYSHAIQYGVVMIALLIINLWTSPGYLWVVWPALGWGVGVALHGLNVFEIVSFFGDDWERKQIARRMRRR